MADFRMKNSSTATKFIPHQYIGANSFTAGGDDPQVARRQQILIPSDLAEISQFPLDAKIQLKRLFCKI